ncbi:MAG: M81 family peptidase [Comamonadaceae bacterium]|nr:MAG: M81 family peptidase [Comamonadaceae bacterium]
MTSQNHSSRLAAGRRPTASTVARIAVAGFQHETNSFSPAPADFASFSRTTSWPGLTVGEGVRDVTRGMNLAIAGFLEAATARGHETVPLLWANATPSGPVTDDAFERISAVLLEGLRANGPWDAVFLDLHGAMVTQSHLDGETEILRRVRAVVGSGVPVVASLDLHANVSPEMVDAADVLSSCRTYPHVDLADTGCRCVGIIETRLAGGAVFKAWRQPDFLIPIQAQTTYLDPARRLYEEALRLKGRYRLLELSLTLGFGPSDTPHCGAAIAAYGDDPANVAAAADEMLALLVAARKEFHQPLVSAGEAALLAIQADTSAGPVILADLRDNPGAGGTGDTTGLLAALIDAGAQECVIGVLFDPASALLAHEAGVGATLTLSLGGKCGGPGSVPFVAEVTVAAIGSGRFKATGPMYGGAAMDLGPMALLQTAQGPRIVVGSVNTHTADQSIFRHLGVDPGNESIIALKSAVHFRADFQPIASSILVVSTPGVNAADLRDYGYRHLRDGVARMP